MANWIEYIVASAIASLVVVTLFGVQLRTQQATTDTATYRSARLSMAGLVDMIERDMTNLGGRHPGPVGGGLFPLPGGAAFPIPAAPDSTSTPRTFRFFSQPERGQPPREIRYEWEAVGTVTLPDTTLDTYKLRRYVDGRPDGGSAPKITHLSFNLFESAGNAITNLENTRQIYVEVRMVSPFGQGTTIQETRWSGVFRPPGLAVTP
jgi:hypothetical protein